ncbi:MAG TPA: FtsX-like permease family protein [Bacteroidales bacterium]|nr:FtsX-like permease family protein [Bacteroidales bacterium]
MISSFAWRNLWRNKLRSSIIIAAVTLGIFAGIFLTAFTSGMINSRIQSIISTEMSHIQIHQPGFLDNDQFSLLIQNADSIVNLVRKTPGVVALSKRIIINSMVASAETGTGVKIIGIDPVNESKVTDLSSKIITGKYIDSTERNPVVISERLSQKLKVKLKNKIIITVQDINKNITGGAFRVVGIYRTDNTMFDESNIFVRGTDLSRLTGLNGNEAHEIAIRLNTNETDDVTKTLSGEFPNLEVKSWQQLSPEAGYLVSAMNQYMFIFIIVILIALCFGIINTMLMVIMERIHELGMLMAIGMNRMRVFTMIMLETIYLSLTGGLTGLILGYVAIRYFEKAGINLFFWKEAFSEIGFSSLIYPVADTKTMVVTTIMVMIAGVISALYPAYKALKLNPAEAIRTQ